MIRAWKIINDPRYSKILCSVSGGSDSDVMLDICWKCDINGKIDYVWIDTGLEYQATKDHLNFLEHKYGIVILRYKAIKPIPLCCSYYGQPFLSKYASVKIGTLQKNNFKFEDKSFEELLAEYPKIPGAIRWWCNMYQPEGCQFNIARNRYLKEFLIENPPNFKISNRCCDYAKKNVVHKLIKENNYDLDITGIRKAENGIRASKYKSCFSEYVGKCDEYRPLFWYSNADKLQYENHYKITHSKCYTEYGLDRTGCCGCPYGKQFENELIAIRKHEPKLYKAVENIFHNSYEYTRKYKDFCRIKKEERKKSKRKADQ